MTENKEFENERYLYGYADVYTPDSFGKPKLHEMGYFTDNMRAFDTPKYSELYYVYGELTDYKEDCEGHYYYDSYLLSVDNDDYYEGRYRCGYEETDSWDDDTDYFENNFAFYIPESSIPQEKREWYRSHADNVR